MGLSLRFYAGLIMLAALMVMIGVLGVLTRDDTTVASPPAQPQEPEVNRIAYVSLDTQVRTIRPEGFDQYAYSHSLWSPDSTSLVFAGRLVGGPVSASFNPNRSAQISHIIVVGTDRNPSAVSIADGILGFWSPK